MIPDDPGLRGDHADAPQRLPALPSSPVVIVVELAALQLRKIGVHRLAIFLFGGLKFVVHQFFLCVL